jgi:D-alanyl-D-alanine dipeptidase
MKWVFIFLVFVVSDLAEAQESTRYEINLNIVRSREAYQELIQINTDNQLVNLESEIPNIVLDIRYATVDNFTGQKIYTEPKAFARRPVAVALKRVQNILAEKGIGLIVYDAYRPYAATIRFYEVFKDTTFVASPYSGSRHNRGAAVDISLMDIKTGKELEMPTDYDSFSDSAAPDFPDLPENVKLNRDLLIKVMHDNGFTVYHSEWWHFDYQNWKDCELLDLSFDMLEESK